MRPGREFRGEGGRSEAEARPVGDVANEQWFWPMRIAMLHHAA
jgi:hypothetical protein